MKLSIVIPMHNEAENVVPLVREIDSACAGLPDKELILVDDGSSDDTPRLIQDLRADYPWLRLIQHPKAGGQSAAVHSGVLAATGEVICTLDGDMQNPPAEIPKMVAPLMAADAPADLALVAGQRVKRQDTWSKKIASKLANGLRAWMLNDHTRDTGCGLKAFRRDAFLAAALFQPHAPLSAGAFRPRRLAGGPCRRGPPRTRRRQFELQQPATCAGGGL